MKIKSKSGQYYEIFPRRQAGEEAMPCPVCSQDRKKKTAKCFNWNHEKNLGNCAHCGEAFYVEKERVREYVYPVPKLQHVSDKTLKWFEGRGISNTTLLRFKITESVEYMPQVGKERNCICFNYFRDEQLINIKYRDGQKNFKLNKGSELIFYNLDAIKDTPECVIVEGEIDCLSMYEAGIYNVVSVPNGASKGNQNLEYLDNCIDHFADKTKIILAVDNDEAGNNLRNELMRRLGRDICYVVSYPEAFKDTNDVLVALGKAEVKKLIVGAYMLPIEGIEQAKDIDDDLMDLFLNGYPAGEKTGFHDFDELLTWAKGYMTIVTGTPGSGKSTFINNILVRLANRADWRVGMFSPEKSPNTVLTAELMEIFIGKTFYNVKPEFRMSETELRDGKDFINDHFWFMKIDEMTVTIDGILEKCRELVRRNGINCFVIDPWNYIEHKRPAGYTETEYISEALTKIKRFKDIYNVHIILVAHPMKLRKNKEGKYDVPGLYDISGSAHFFNKPDVGIVVYRDYEKGLTSVHVQKVRWKFLGHDGSADFTFNVFNNSYTGVGETVKNEYYYHLDKQAIKDVPF